MLAHSMIQFGLWSLVTKDGPKIGANYCWIVRCVCGVERAVVPYNLKSGRSTNCGCERERLRIEAVKRSSTKHGMSRTSIYEIWSGMIKRCENPNFQQYKDYGGRGIKVCDRWRYSFQNFLADMGDRPSNLYTLDRYPNNDGNYEPSNCRWATRKQQTENRR